MSAENNPLIFQKALNKLYHVCRKTFRERYELLRQTTDDKLFLANALYCEICANTISLCIELACDLTTSPAMETSCRSILEAITLWRMLQSGDLDDEQIANYQHQSALLFYGNIFDTAEKEKDRFFSDDQSELMKKQIEWIVSDCDRAFEAYRKKYGDKLDERASREAIREGLFFTYKKPSDKKRNTFSKLFNRYVEELDRSHELYNRISFFAHPWYLDNAEDLDLVKRIRLNDVGRCLEAVQKFLSNEIENIPSAEGAIESGLRSLGSDWSRSETIESICSKLCLDFAHSARSLPFSSLCFAILRESLIEMNIMNGLGYPEIALSKFQSVAEFWAMNAILNDAADPKKFAALHHAFDYSTRIQMRNLGGFNQLPLKEEGVLQDAFTNAFEKPSITFDEYKTNVAKNSLLFLKDERAERNLGFLDVVRSGMEIAFAPEQDDRRKQTILAYLFSIDVHHATGFCYTENRDCWRLLSHLGLRGIYQSIWLFVGLMITSPYNDPSLPPVCKTLIKLIDDETKEIGNLNLKYPAA